ncbi:MAG: hypothetical protein VX252_13070 [Myxococcota bacterium]|nr:hypothetical protein [Myxococcota bacterium]
MKSSARGKRKILPEPGRFGSLVLLAVLAMSGGTGCATYSDRMKSIQQDVVVGNYPAAIEGLNKAIGAGPGQLPNSFNSDTALAVLDRGTLEQATEQFENSSIDYGAADKELDLLDLSNDTVGQIGKYFFSDSSTKYKASPVEKLALNGFNMLNYLALGRLSGASVEARRFTVMRDYLNQFDPGHAHAAFGSYLAGFTFDQLGDYTRAMRYYDEALQGASFESLRAPVARLAQLTNYRGKKIKQFLAQKRAPHISAKETANLLVVVSIGRVPYKVPERMPIGAAIGVAGSFITGNPDILGYSVFKFVNYPELSQPPSLYDGVRLEIDGKSAGIELATNLGIEIENEYKALKPRIIGAALSRMIVRAAAAEGMRQAGNQESGGLGWVLALATEASLVAMDKPDTRSWMFMPGRVYVYQTQLTPGKHEVSIRLGRSGSVPQQHTIDLKAKGYAAIVVTAPR